jgi:sialate O-acetylesterase
MHHWKTDESLTQIYADYTYPIRRKDFEMTHRTGFWLIAVLVLATPARAEVTLPAIFGDHMVLQQKESVPVWGWAEPGEKVRVKGDWQWLGKTTQADENGKWNVRIRTPKAGKTVTLSINGQNNQIVISDILLGEVWICSGQSNMELRMNDLGSGKAETDIKEAAFPQIRLFTVKRAYSSAPKDNCEGQWQVCTPESVNDFSAVGYYFGKNLHDHLGVPIGLVNTSWGGTVAEAWTSLDGLAGFERFRETLDYLKDPQAEEAAMKQAHAQKMEQWEAQLAAIDPGTREGWFADTFDAADWQEMDQPQKWSQADNGLKDVDGIVWFRRVTNLPPGWAQGDLELHLGPIDDIDTVWFNGVRIGSTTGDWRTPRVYTIPASITRVGKNTIAVRIIDAQGDGGFVSDSKDAMRIGPRGADAKGCATVAKTWKYRIGYQGGVPDAPQADFKIHQNSPTALYNGMIAPLIPFRIAGAIWYQGESNCYDPILYRTLFPAMITDWRNNWGQGDFAFYYVQIAPFQYTGRQSQAVREAQLMTFNAAPHVGMAVTMDIGEEKDIHPRNKHDVGDRLARWALAKTYGQEGIVYSGPIYREMQVKDGKVRVSFDSVDGGLVATDGQLRDFEIAGADRKFVPAEAVIDGDTVIVSGNEVKEPVAVRYGWSNWVTGSLFNKAGLPASSFRTDDWPLQ